MGTQGNLPVLLTIRGTRSVKDIDAARKLHNETAGSDQGIAACRALGDLSHKVYVAASDAGKLNDAQSSELFFMDVWKDADGIQKFFSNPQVVEQGGRLFSEKEPGVYMPATGAFSLHLPVPMARTERYIGILKGKVKSPEAAINVFGEGLMAGLGEMRKAGLVSHELYVKLGPPSADGSAEILAYDVWADLKGMLAAYGSEAMNGLGKVFVGKPSGSIWKQAPGAWNEW